MGFFDISCAPLFVIGTAKADYKVSRHSLAGIGVMFFLWAAHS
jgi:hypothetical protein